MPKLAQPKRPTKEAALWRENVYLREQIKRVRIERDNWKRLAKGGK
jgi:hypothetical protein